MRVVVVAGGLPTPTNAAQWAFVAARLRGYAKAGHEACCLVPPMKEAPTSSDAYGVIQVEDRDQAMREILRISPHVVACHAPAPASLSGKVASEAVEKYRTFLWIHGYESLFTAFHGYLRGWKVPASLLRDAIRMMSLRRIMDKAAGVVYVSQWMRKAGQMGTGRPRCSSFVIPNPVDTTLFRAIAKRESRGKLRLIAVRGLNHKYGVDLAIRGLAGLDCAELTVVGNGPMKEEYERLAKSLNSPVSFVPATFQPHQLARLYGEYDVFVAPSRAEAQGVAMCEAMSCGLPVVATRIGGIPEFVTDQGSGILVDPERPDLLRQAVRLLAGDRGLVHKMGQAAADEVRRKCSEEAVIGRELRVLAQAEHSV